MDKNQPKKTIASICVYCGASTGTDDQYLNFVKSTGIFLADHHIRLIYGGGGIGLMGTLANATLSAGGQAIGIIPHFLKNVEITPPHLTELIVTDTMHERKKIMTSLADGFIILPGGLGTLDEFFEILTWRQLGLHNKPIVVMNINGFWDSLKDLISHLIDTDFVKAEAKDFYTYTDDIKHALDYILSTKAT
ncbi:MAG: TIGR00730 family Rossman fold protein [Pseudomonadota bacterium]